jgi:hypothetical protein
VRCREHGDEPSGAAEEVLVSEKGLLSMKLIELFFVSLLVSRQTVRVPAVLTLCC